ncbi:MULTISPECIES: ribosome biogenesis GTPase YqeH [Virgibacillus]|uniref:GTPase n=1 Tax=Virgibacillus pantothenticus TaxID=1473 RepID=A0A0L0QQT8_VIRPA|nr:MULTISPECIES: ribosome biogenesis GTPase YqeH [Virgibacillus]API90602.1 ribosome biogenesis GTPase YqeH [Virgibacillus sp. 6R]KNE20558.1 GTPase [Virgibacillus pantothenticus]MBS7429718.1 ribosome biogenesis GTPase YqeH [Virgibacillus sp. 19R1-5]MED3738681.1 ribosome biogenesis GTPase YqeH [Virgibacillus pantothenticus]QTY17685.1 ribosome biogenesis GTPase YqeH [Virgibacillus pantothenticus]
METETIDCQGCGVRIQTTAKDQPGYTPVSSLQKEVVLCQRCFRLKHYNEIQDVSITDDDFLKMVSSIRDTSGLVVHIVDIFDVDGSLIHGLPRLVGEKSILLVGNKMDLLPKSVNTRKLLQWLRSQAKQAGIKVTDACLISSAKGHGIAELSEKIEQYRQGDNVYIVGTTNVGKSTFINRLIKQSTGFSEVITTSYFPGTTLGFIEIPLDDRSALIDTPGIVNKQQMAHYISGEDLKLITPNKEIKPRIYQLNDGQTLFFGGLARLDFIKGDKQSFVCYFSNQLPIHRTKLEKADDLFANHCGELLTPPTEASIDQIPPMISDTFRIKEGKYDIVFPGLGWVSILGEGATVAANRPKGVAVSIRQSFN